MRDQNQRQEPEVRAGARRACRGRRRRGHRTPAVVAVVALAVTAAALALPELSPVGAQTSPDPSAPTLTYEPATGLVDGQVVEVAGSGFEPGAFVVLAACGAATISLWDCDLDRWITPVVGSDGTFRYQFEVVGLLQEWGPDGATDIDCRVAGACDLVAAVADMDDFEYRIEQRTPLRFDPESPLLPPPGITVEPSSQLVDGQVVSITGSGFRQFDVPLMQCVADLYEPDSLEACRNLDYPVVTDGGFVAEVGLRARLSAYDPETGEPSTVDCRSPENRCVLVAGWTSRAQPVDLHFDPDGALLPPPALEVSPSSDLVDGDEVSVAGSGFGAHGYVRVALCEAAVGTGSDHPHLRACDPGAEAHVTTDAAGAFATTLSVHGDFQVPWIDTPRSVDCRDESGCEVVVVDLIDDSWSSAAVSFGPTPEPRGRYLDPVFSDVEVTHDVRYLSTTDHLGRPIDLRMDIYEPAGDTARERPAVVWMHGGWFIFGDKTDMAPYAHESARRGYVGISLQYRLRPDITSSDLAGVVAAAYDAYDDSTAAVSWLQDNAETYRIDPEAIMAGGYSAGGVNAYHLAFMPGQRGPTEPLIAAALPIAGIPFVGPEPGDPPIIGFHATDDATVPVSVARQRCAEAPTVAVLCEWVEYPTGGHGIVSSRFRDIIRRGHDFVAAHALDPLGYLEPTADAGGPYEVIEGSTITLDGAFSRGTSGGSWAPDDRLDDPRSPTPTFTGLDDGATSLTLTARDHFGAEGSDAAEVVTLNAPPVVESATATVASRRTVRIRADITDPGLADTHEAEIRWGDGEVTSATVVQSEGSATITASHTPKRAGTYEVTLTVTDDDGGSVVWQQSVTVRGGGIVSVFLEPIREVVVRVIVAWGWLLSLFR